MHIQSDPLLSIQNNNKETTKDSSLLMDLCTIYFALLETK